MFESRNICDLGLLQNARTHGPRGAVKTIEKPILQRTQVHYFCSGNSLQDPSSGFPVGEKSSSTRTLLSHVFPDRGRSHCSKHLAAAKNDATFWPPASPILRFSQLDTWFRFSNPATSHDTTILCRLVLLKLRKSWYDLCVTPSYTNFLSRVSSFFWRMDTHLIL